MRGLNTGEDLEPLDMVKDSRFVPGSSSDPVTNAGHEQRGEEGEVVVEEEVVEEVPVGFCMDQIRLSTSTEGDIEAIREAFGIPDSVTIRLPDLGELRSSSKVSGETLVHPFFFDKRLRIPLPA